VIRAHPELTFVIDHLGIVQGPHREQPTAPFERLDDLLALSDLRNVAVKLSGLPTLALEAYPYPDPVRCAESSAGSGTSTVHR